MYWRKGATDADPRRYQLLGGCEKSPERRAGISVLHKGRVIAFGGGNGPVTLNDVWALDVNSLQWEQLITNGKKLNARAYHTANLVSSNMVVGGGSDGMTCYPDVWVLNLGTT